MRIVIELPLCDECEAVLLFVDADFPTHMSCPQCGQEYCLDVSQKPG